MVSRSEIVTVARTSANAIRSYGFPVLETGNMSFPNGQYFLEFESCEDRSSFILKHRLEGAPLLVRLLTEGKARYACTVSSPASSYRETHLSDVASQRIQWREDDIGEPPLFTAMVVSVESFDLQLSEHRDGVHGIWDNQLVQIEKGNRLAVTQVVQLRSSILQLLRLQANNEVREGMFYVDAETEEGFRFRVSLNPDLHAALQFMGSSGSREHIMTHIVTACFALIQRDFRDDDEDDGGWRSHQNLRALADFLRLKGLPHWSDDDFRPEMVATELYPHRLPSKPEGDDFNE